MTRTPDDATVAAWIGIARAQRGAVSRVELRLKAAGLPPLAWYDVLWELEKAGEEGLRPYALEKAMLFEQYNLSRLVDRLEKAGLVARRACLEDRRGHRLMITEAGLAERRLMWDAYAAAIEREIGARLTLSEARTLAALLAKLE
jgi:DNA-binding MarR family transcriptional regulator